MKKIRDVLLEKKKVTWKELRESTGIADKELSYDLKKLEANFEITWEKDRKDRRVTWYMLKNKNKALAETKRYETTEFILGMKEPDYYEVKGTKGRMNILLSCFFESEEPVSEQDRSKTKRMFDTMMKQMKPGMILLEPHKFKKMTMVFAFERQGVKP